MALDPYRYFRLEARELLEQFGKDILELERHGSSPATIQRLLRVAHTLKGAARVVKQTEIADRAHAVEDSLALLREVTGTVPSQLIETLLRHADDINSHLQVLTQSESQNIAVQNTLPEAQGAPALLPQNTLVADENLRTVRTDLAEMDALLDGVAETHAQLNGLRAAAGLAIEARHMADLLLEQLVPQGSQAIRLHTGGPENVSQRMPERVSETALELRRRLGRLERNLGASAEQIDRELNQLRDAAEQLRLVSASVLFASLERSARDTAQELGKQLEFVAKGGDIRLDAYVLGTIQKALVQIVRNAVAHGIEFSAERHAAGKPQAGQLSVNVVRRGRWIAFACRDDGNGVDLEAVRRIAIRRGLLSADAADPGPEDLIALLLRGGISTSDTVTKVAGRGVGLDVVREAVEQLGGEAKIHTRRGQGTSFELIVPLSVTSLDVLMVEAAGSVVSIPLDAVRTSLRIPAGEISWRPAGAAVRFEQTVLPFMALPELLYGVRSPPDRTWSAVAVAGADGLAVLGVDRLLGTARVVARPLPDLMPASIFAAGASLDSEGNPQLLLDPDGLVHEARHADGSKRGPEQVRPPVLVIDDSLTTRMLEQSILESAGYEVDVAASAEAGLISARHKNYGLFLVDVEMPGMDGFSFVETIRADPTLRHIPAILVTSRAAPEDRERGREAGANGYIVKSAFDQIELLAMIRPLLGNLVG
jgi:two-component system chemotaxis sensor kinase CheA